MKNEPAITVGLATTFLGALLLLLRVFGVQISDEQSGAILQAVDAAWPFLALVPGLAGFLVVRSRVLGPQTARRNGIDPRTGDPIVRKQLDTPPDGSVRRTSVLLVLLACLALPAPGCGAALPAGASQVLATVFNSVGIGLQAIETVREWLKRVEGAPGLTPQAHESIAASLAEAEALLLDARELGLKGADVAEQAEKTKDQGMVALQQALDTLKQLGLRRGGELLAPPDGTARADVPQTTRVRLPPEVK